MVVGRCLTRCKWWTFCLIMSFLNCLSPPLETVLGVFTIIVLLRDTVKDRFAGKLIDAIDPEDEGIDNYRALPDRRPTAEPDDRRYYSPPGGQG